MKVTQQIIKGSGHCCVCATVCFHIGPIRLCAMHERIESGRLAPTDKGEK